MVKFKELAEKFIALYIRVSTDEQAEQGFSIDSQKERLEFYCKAQGWSNYRFYIDDGYTGTNMTRPALQRLIKHVEDGKVSNVIVYRIDRLSRKQKDVLYLIEDVFEKHAVGFRSSSESFDTTTAFGKAMLGILAVFAQLERDTIIERTTGGRRKRISSGFWPGGRVPLGLIWKSKEKTFDHHPFEKKAWFEGKQLLMRGESFLGVSHFLQPLFPDRTIDHAAVKRIYSNPLYAGFMVNHENELVQGNWEPFITIEEFGILIAEIKRRDNGKPIVSPDKPHLLSGILICGQCGDKVYRYPLKMKRNGKKYEYDRYACRNQHVRKKDRLIEKCNLGYKKVEEVDELLVNTIKEFKLSPSKFMAAISKKQDLPEDNEEIRKHLLKNLADVEKKLDRWYTAFEQGEIDPRRLKTRIDELETEKQDILQRLNDIPDTPDERLVIEKSREMLNAIADSWDEMTLTERQSAIRMLIDHVVIFQDNSIEIKWAT